MSDISREELLDWEVDFGEHHGKKLKDVPISYCKWLIEEGVGKDRPVLREALERFEEDIMDADNWFIPPTLGEAV